MKICLGILLVILSTNVFAWNLTQVQIKHVQVGNANRFFMTVDGDTTISGCNESPGWVSFDLSNITEKDKILISMALSARMAGIAVDIGSTQDGCVDGYTHLNYIRVGNKN